MNDIHSELPAPLREPQVSLDTGRTWIRRNVVIPTAYGQMIVNRFDAGGEAFPGVGMQLLSTGSFDHQEMVLLHNLAATLPEGAVILDLGANIGVNTLVLAAACAERGGTVYAFEPQRLVFQMLCGNVALNSLDNVHCLNKAVGRSPGRIGIPKLDYEKCASFGSLELGRAQREPIGQHPTAGGPGTEEVEMCAIDGLGLARVDLVKIDVEGMEMDALAGARESLERFRPVLFIEWIKSDAQALRAFLDDLDYTLYQVEHNFLALPPAWRPATGEAPAEPALNAPGNRRPLRVPGNVEPRGLWRSLCLAARDAERAFRHYRKGLPI